MQITKTVDLGNDCQIKIASLTFDQIEEMIGADTPKDSKAQKAAAWNEVINAVRNVPGQESWTRKSVVDILEGGYPALQAVSKFQELRTAVLEISGYEVKKNEPQPIAETTDQPAE